MVKNLSNDLTPSKTGTECGSLVSSVSALYSSGLKTDTFVQHIL